MIISFEFVNQGSGSGCTLMEKTVEIVDNGNSSITPDAGYDGMSKVNVNVNVPLPEIEDRKSITIDSNRTENVIPSEGFEGLKGVDITVNVPQKPEMEKSETITENKVVEILPDEGKVLSKATVTVNVPTTTINNQTKSIAIAANGQTTVSYDPEYTGLESVKINVNVPTGGGGEGSLDLSVIGYDNQTLEDSGLNDAVAYSKTKYDEWNPENTSAASLYANDAQLMFAPNIDTSNVTDFTSMFEWCYNLITIPKFNTSKGTNFKNMLAYTNLSFMPQLDTSSGTDFSYMLRDTKITEISGLDTSNGINLEGIFSNSELKVLNDLDTSKTTNFKQMFYNCDNLISIPNLNTSNGTDFYYMFCACFKLKSVPEFDVSKGTNFGGMFINCNGLTDLGGFVGLSKDLDLSNSKLLTHDSLMNVINKMKDLTGGTQATLTLGSTNLAKLSEDEKAIATGKNWILA